MSSSRPPPEELDEAVKAIGSNVSGIQGDVAKLANLDRLYETVSNAKGRIQKGRVFLQRVFAENIGFLRGSCRVAC